MNPEQNELDTAYQHENLAEKASDLFEVLSGELIQLQDEMKGSSSWSSLWDHKDWDVLDSNQAA